jgi:hypothetical protein
VQVEWDPRKARLNARKHGVALADAVAVLEDETALTMRDPFPQDEERPRGSLQNRPMRVTSKPANEREAGQDLLYLAGGLAGNSFLRF